MMTVKPDTASSKKREKKEKKRRLAQGQAQGPDPKEQGQQADGPWEEQDGRTLVQLEQDQEVLFMGHAVLEVLEGTVAVDGKLLRVGGPATKLSTAGRNGLAITIHAQPKVQQVPLRAQGGVRFSLTAPLAPPRLPPPAAEPQGEPGDKEQPSAGDAMRLRFTLHLPDSPGAPTALSIPPDWEQAVQDVCEAVQAAAVGGGRSPVVAVCGVKNMGKSSLSRLLVNNLLNYSRVVMYLDTDCGQPEFTPPCMVSLVKLEEVVLGPSCTHMRAPVAAHFLGDVSPQGDPELHCSSVHSLYRWYCDHAADPTTGVWPPLVVNTHGWVKGIGLDVLAEILSVLDPTHLMKFTSPSQNKNLPNGIFWSRDPMAPPCVILPLNQAPFVAAADAAAHSSAGAPGAAEAPGAPAGAAGARAWSLQRLLKNAECRALQWHAWAKAVTGQDGTWSCFEGAELWQDATRLAALRPLCVSLDDVTVQLLYERDLPRSQIGYVLNGAVVGLAVAGPQGGAARERGQAAGPPGPPLPCLGLGLVRAVDMEERLLYVLTPLAHSEELQRVDTLLVGRSDLPTSLLQAGDAVVSPYLALFSLSAEGTASGGAKSRTTLQRKSLMK